MPFGSSKIQYHPPSIETFRSASHHIESHYHPCETPCFPAIEADKPYNQSGIVIQLSVGLLVTRVLTTHILYIHICAILYNHTLGSHQITRSNCPSFPGFPLEVDLPTFQFCGFADFRFRIWFKCICISSFRKWSWCTIPCSTLLWEPSLPKLLCIYIYIYMYIGGVTHCKLRRIRRYNRITKCRNTHWGWLSKSPWWTIRGLLLSGQFRSYFQQKHMSSINSRNKIRLWLD